MKVAQKAITGQPHTLKDSPGIMYACEQRPTRITLLPPSSNQGNSDDSDGGGAPSVPE